MIDKPSIGILSRKSRSPLSSELNRAGAGHLRFGSALEFILDCETSTISLSSYAHLLLEATPRSDLQWTELDAMKKARELNPNIGLTLLVQEGVSHASVRCFSGLKPEGTQAFIGRMQSLALSPSILLFEGALTKEAFQSGWAFLQKTPGQIYRVPSPEPNPHQKPFWVSSAWGTPLGSPGPFFKNSR